MQSFAIKKRLTLLLAITLLCVITGLAFHRAWLSVSSQHVVATYLYITNGIHSHALTNYMSFSAANKAKGERWLDGNLPSAAINLENRFSEPISLISIVQVKTTSGKDEDSILLEAKGKGEGVGSIQLEGGESAILHVAMFYPNQGLQHIQLTGFKRDTWGRKALRYLASHWDNKFKDEDTETLQILITGPTSPDGQK